MDKTNYLRDKYVTPAIIDLCANVAEDRKFELSNAMELIDLLKDWMGEDAFGVAAAITPTITEPEPAKPTGFVVPTYDYTKKEESPKKCGRKPGVKTGPQLRTEERNRILDECLVLCDAAHESGLEKVLITPEDVGCSHTFLKRASEFFVRHFVNSHKPYALDKKPVHGVMGLTVFLRHENN